MTMLWFHSALLLLLLLAIPGNAIDTPDDSTKTMIDADTYGKLHRQLLSLRAFDVDNNISPLIRDKVNSVLADDIMNKLRGVQQRQATDIARPHRELQLLDTTCTPAAEFEDDDDYLLKFSNDYRSMCTCGTTGDSVNAFLAENPTPSADNPAAALPWVDLLNEALNSLEYTDTVMCANNCESCFLDWCGFLEYMSSTTVKAGLTMNFNALDLLPLLTAPDPEAAAEVLLSNRIQLDEIMGSIGSCLTLTKGGTEKVCYSVDYSLTGVNTTLANFNETMVLAQDVSCTASVDGDECNVCELAITDTGDFCVTVDCTNKVANATIATCEGDPAEGFVGPLEPYYYLEVADESASTTVGECKSFPPTVSPTMTDPDRSPDVTPVPTKAPAPSGGYYISAAFGWTVLAGAAALVLN